MFMPEDIISTWEKTVMRMEILIGRMMTEHR